MKRLTEQLWFLAAAICLLTAISTFVAVAGNHQISEEPSSELVDVVEGVEAIDQRRQRRVKRKQAAAEFPNARSAAPTKLRLSCRFFKPTNERDRLNGLGGYLRT